MLVDRGQHFIHHPKKNRPCSVTEILQQEEQDLVSQITDTNEGDSAPPYLKGGYHTPSRVPTTLVTPQNKKRILGEIESGDNGDKNDPPHQVNKRIAL